MLIATMQAIITIPLLNAANRAFVRTGFCGLVPLLPCMFHDEILPVTENPAPFAYQPDLIMIFRQPDYSAVAYSV